MNINDLQKVIHAYANEKGWWDSPRSLGALIALCHSELSEALEAYRGNGISTGITQVIYVEGKPEGFAVELADTVIRILDMVEYYHQDISRWTEPTFSAAFEKIDFFLFGLGLKMDDLTLPDYIAIAHKRLSNAYEPGIDRPDEANLAFCVMVIVVACKKYDIPLEEAIRVKMEYNRTRSYRHGGKTI